MGKKSTAPCRWGGHGTDHTGPAVTEIWTIRPCGHDRTGPTPTCLPMLEKLMANHGRAPVAVPCPDCNERNHAMIIDPEADDPIALRQSTWDKEEPHND